jgi:outer membrane protein assembly factor BamB
MFGWRHVAAVVTLTVLIAPATALAQTPLGIVENTLGRFDRDTLQPVGATINLPEPHAAPVFAPDRERFAIGLSKAGVDRTPRIGLWIVDPDQMTVVHEVHTGIAAEAVVYPGVVAALLQSGELLVVDPKSGSIRSRRRIGRTSCAPTAVQVPHRGVIVNEVRAAEVEVTIVESDGRVNTLSIPLKTPGRHCRKVGLAASSKRVYITATEGVIEFDPVARRTTRHQVGGGTSAAIVPGGLAVAGPRGVSVVDTTTWKTRWRDRTARSVLTSGSTVIATGSDVRARDARTGTLRWRASGNALAVAAGRVYAQPAVLDLRTGERVGTHPPATSTFLFAEAPVTAAASGQAAFPYQRLAQGPSEDVLAVQNGAVYATGVTRTSVMAYPLSGAALKFELPRRVQVVDWLVAGTKGVAAITGGYPFRLYYGPPRGPLRLLRRKVVTAAVAGSKLVTLEGPYEREWIVTRDLSGGKARRVARPARGMSYMLAAGHYVSVSLGKALIVLDLRTGREVYRVRPRSMSAYRLGADGRIAIVDPEFERIQTATPTQPKLRTVANLLPFAYPLALVGDEIVFVESLSRSTGRIVSLKPGGTRRALTPRMPISNVAYDGKTLAFISGTCLFAGPPPAQPPDTPPPADCYPE